MGKGSPLLPRCSSQNAAPCPGLMHSVLGWILPQYSTNPGTDREEAEEKAGFEGFFFSFFSPAPTTLYGLVLQKPKHLPCSTCFCWGWDKLQGTQSDGRRYVCKCMVACVHECLHAWVWCTLGVCYQYWGGRGRCGVWLCVLAENGGIQKL